MAWHGFLNRQPHPTSAMLLLLSLTILSCSTILPTTALRLDEKCDESAFSSAFDNYTNLYCPEVSETASPVRISFDRPIPSYVKPLRYAVNSFAKFQIGEEHDAEQFSFYMDGYQKMTIIDFCDNDSGALWHPAMGGVTAGALASSAASALLAVSSAGLAGCRLLLTRYSATDY